MVRLELEEFDVYVTVYNLDVDDFHTNFVGDENVLVHNTYDDENLSQEKVDRHNRSAPRNNQRQNEQIKTLMRKHGIPSNKRQEVHDLVSGQGYSFSELDELLRELYGRK